MSCRLAPLIRVKSTRLLGVPVPNLIMGNVPKRAGVSGNAMAMKADLTWDNVEFCRSQTDLPVIKANYSQIKLESVRTANHFWQ